VNWSVIYTSPQQELKVNERLNKIGIEAYCPVKEEIRQWSDRKKKILVPVIKSYVFVRVPIAERFRVFDVPGVVNYLYWLGKPAIVYHQEITALKASLESSCNNFKVESYVVGATIKIDKGLFKENTGTIIRLNNKCTTVVLEQLGLIVTISN
jgi:transcriptional antiterminator RfaH